MFALVAAVSLALAAPRSPDVRTGWKGVSWGAPPPASATCSVLGIVKRCTVGEPEDQLVGDILMQSVVLTFWDDRLFAVEVRSGRQPEALVLASALEQAYGSGTRDDGATRWQGDRVAIRFAFDAEFGGATLTYTYLPILADLPRAAQADAAERVTKAAADL